MKKLVLLIFLLFISLCSYSQKITKNTIDKFTGSSIVQTSDVDIADSFWCSITKVNSVYILNLYFNGGHNTYTSDKDDELLLKLKSGEIISLKNRELVTSELIQNTINGRYYSHFTISPTYIIDTEQLNKLKSNPIEIIRLSLSTKIADGDVTEKHAQKLMKLFNLFSI
jgi:hypothetical protein